MPTQIVGRSREDPLWPRTRSQHRLAVPRQPALHVADCRVLVQAARHAAALTRLARAQIGTPGGRLFKLGGEFGVSVRGIVLHLLERFALRRVAEGRHGAQGRTGCRQRSADMAGLLPRFRSPWPSGAALVENALKAHWKSVRSRMTRPETVAILDSRNEPTAGGPLRRPKLTTKATASPHNMKRRLKSSGSFWG